MSEQGRRPDQVASSERLFALSALIFMAGVIVGIVLEVVRGLQ